MLKFILLASLLTAGFTNFVFGDDELKFIVLGDWGERLLRGQDWVAAAMAEWAEENDPAFIVTTGDNIYPRGLRSPVDPQMDRKWRNVYHNYSSLADLPWYVSLGNHDYGEWVGEEWNEVEMGLIDEQWILPHLWYDFEKPIGLGGPPDAFGTVHFIIIDTETYTKQIERNDWTKMADWLEDTLKHSTADWKLVFGHRHIFSAGDVFEVLGPVTGDLLNGLVPIMERYNVDAYICGHDHNLQHMRNVSGSGMDYVISGAGGALLSRRIPGNEEHIREVYKMDTIFFQMTYGFITLKIKKGEIVYDYFDHNADLVYTFTRTKDVGQPMIVK